MPENKLQQKKVNVVDARIDLRQAETRPAAGRNSIRKSSIRFSESNLDTSFDNDKLLIWRRNGWNHPND